MPNFGSQDRPHSWRGILSGHTDRELRRIASGNHPDIRSSAAIRGAQQEINRRGDSLMTTYKKEQMRQALKAAGIRRVPKGGQNYFTKSESARFSSTVRRVTGGQQPRDDHGRFASR